MATLGEIRDTVLGALYEAKFTTEEGCRNLTWLRYRERWGRQAFRKAIEPIRSLFDRVLSSGEYGLSVEGALLMEEQGLAPPDLHDRNEACRLAMLLRLADAYQEGGPHSCAVPIPTLLARDADRTLADANLRVLIHQGFVFETEAMAFCRITLRGLRAATDERQRRAIAEELGRIEALDPDLRDRALTGCFARLAGRAGWETNGGIDGAEESSEALDVSVRRGRELYLLDCHWTDQPLGADAASALEQRIIGRPGVNGISVSMSGFAGSFEARVRESRNARFLLSFGPADVRSLAMDGAHLDDLLTEKVRALIKGEVLWR
jgi:hypothetical protein